MAWIHVQLIFSLILICYFGSVRSKELGSPCTRDSQCKVDNSQCSSGVCTCKHFHAQLGTTSCLESKLLGRECKVSEQCSLRVANSTCRNGHCHCSEGFLRFRKHTCLGPAKVGDVCYSDEHCRLWAENSHCKFLIPKLFGKCVCDGEGNCASHEASTTTEDPQPTTPTDPPQESGNTTEDNSKPQTANPLFVDPFLHQKEHLRPPDSQDRRTEPSVGEGATGVEGVQEGSKYRVESNGVKGDVAAVSLGYPCRSDEECQKRDAGSLCVEGICDCAVKGNDRASCGRDNTGCGPETFQCRDSGMCISWFFVCDGRSDCPDSSDEECEGAECPKPSFRCGVSGSCVSLAVICDGVKNCPDGEDERLCGRNATSGGPQREQNSSLGVSTSCPHDSFRCSDGQCLPKFEFCNAIPKCRDGSDESPHLCSSQTGNRKRDYCPFECGNGRCRSTAIVCSGRDGCGDNSDEAHCSVCRCPQLPTPH